MGGTAGVMLAWALAAEQHSAPRVGLQSLTGGLPVNYTASDGISGQQQSPSRPLTLEKSMIKARRLTIGEEDRTGSQHLNVQHHRQRMRVRHGAGGCSCEGM